jgi:hypothetical protein
MSPASFPEAEDLGPHAIAFAQVMFAHSEFEREIRSLQGVITNDLSFGKRRSKVSTFLSAQRFFAPSPRRLLAHGVSLKGRK